MNFSSLIPVKAVVFDFDGTLVQSNDIKMKGLFDVAALVGADASLVEWVLSSNPGDRKDIYRVIVTELAKRNILPSERNSEEWQRYLVAQYSDLCEKGIVSAPEVDGATDLLKMPQSRGIPAYINSATPDEAIQVIIQKRGWARYFKKVMGRPPSKFKNLEKILIEEKVQAVEVVFVGDSEADREAATELNCHYIGLENQYSKYKMSPMFKIHSLRELIND